MFVPLHSFVGFDCGKVGKVCMVRYKVNLKIEGKKKLLVSKFNSLIKHSNLRKCIVVRPNVVIGWYYVCPPNTHVRKWIVFTVIRFDIIVSQLVNGVKEEKIQFVVIKLFKQGEPILNTLNLFSNFWRWWIAHTNIGFILNNLHHGENNEQH